MHRTLRKQCHAFALACTSFLATLPAAAGTSRDFSLDFRCGGQGTPDERIVACDRIIAAGGGALLTPAQAYGLRANALSAKDQYEAAVADYGRTIALDPRNPTAHFNRGLAHVALGDEARAVADFDEQIHLQPAYLEAFYQRGLIRTRQQQFDLAIRDFDEEIRLYHSSGDEVCCRGILMHALYRRGLARLGLGDLDRAIDDFGGAIAIYPVADFFASRGEAHRRAGHRFAAIRDGTIAFVLDRWGRRLEER